MNIVEPPAHLLALGLGPEATAKDVERAHKLKVRPLQKRASNAPEHLRDQAERELTALEASTQTLLATLRAGSSPAPAAVVADEPVGGHYSMLGLSRSASAEQVEAAFGSRSRLAQHHSSVGTNPEVRQQAKLELSLLTEARRVLLDPQKRAAHDEALAGSTFPVAPGPRPPVAVGPDAARTTAAAPAATAGPPRPEPQTAAALTEDERLQRAERRFAQGDVAQVVALLDPLVRRAQPHTGAARMLGLAAARQGDAALANEALVLARPAHPGDPEVAATLVEVLVALDRQGEAAAFAERAAREDSTARLAVTRAVLQALCTSRQPDIAVRLAEQLLGPRSQNRLAADCLVDVLLIAADAHCTQLADGRLVLTSATQCARVHDIVARLHSLPVSDADTVVRMRRMRVQLLDARRHVQWTNGERWLPRTAAPPALVTRWGTA